MTDEHIKADISLYLAGSLAESRNRQIEAHAASCEKCRYALSKARAKQARIKREALKKASAEPFPNLFLARQGRQVVGASRPPAQFPWMLVGFVLVGGGGVMLYRYSSLFARNPRVPAAEETAAAPADPIIQASSTSTPSPAAVLAPPAVSTPSAAAPPKPAAVILVQQQWQGPDSDVKDFRLVVIRNKEAWDKLRGEMQTPFPDVEFEQHVVVGVLAGERAAGSAVTFGKIKDMDSEVYVPFRVTSADVQISSGTAPATVSGPSHPYALSLLPRLDKKIRLTQKEAAP